MNVTWLDPLQEIGPLTNPGRFTLGRADEAVAEEVEQMRTWRIAPTASRSIVGVMNEFAFLADAWRDRPTHQDLVGLSVRLAATPLGPLRSRHGFPDRELAAIVPGTALR